MLHRNKVESPVEQVKKELAFDQGTPTEDVLDITLRGFVPIALSIRENSFATHDFEKDVLDIAKNGCTDKSTYSKIIDIPMKQYNSAGMKCLDPKKTSIKNLFLP